MDKKKLEVIGAIILVVALILVVVFLLNRPEKIDQPQDDTVAGSEAFDDSKFPTRANASAEVLIEPDPIARAFVERFGSFSSESDYANVEDVLPLTTLSLQNRLQGIAAAARREISGSFYGVSTKYISMNTVSKTDTQAVLLVTTQRNESFDSPKNTSSRYQDIELEMVKNDDGWLVDGFAWQ